MRSKVRHALNFTSVVLCSVVCGASLMGCKSIQTGITTISWSKPELRARPGWSPEAVNSMATLTTTSGDKALDDSIAYEFDSVMTTKGYDIVSRSKVDHLVQELKFERNGLTDAETVQKVGKILNVSHVLVVTVPPVMTERLQGGGATASARVMAQILETSTGRVLISCSESENASMNIYDLVSKLSERVASAMPSKITPAASATPSK